jgi:hypothetical protein
MPTGRTLRAAAFVKCRPGPTQKRTRQAYITATTTHTHTCIYAQSLYTYLSVSICRDVMVLRLVVVDAPPRCITTESVLYKTAVADATDAVVVVAAAAAVVVDMDGGSKNIKLEWIGVAIVAPLEPLLRRRLCHHEAIVP